jgi:hypothetical protein
MLTEIGNLNVSADLADGMVTGAVVAVTVDTAADGCVNGEKKR